MKFFANKIWKKIIIAFVLIDLFAFAKPTEVKALPGIGGTLMKPAAAMTVGLCDGIIGVIHKVVIGEDNPLIRVSLEKGKWNIWKVFLSVVAALAVVGVVAMVIANPAVALPLIFKVIGKVAVYGSVLLITGTGAIAAGMVTYAIEAFDDNELDIPFYTISPEEIFRNELDVFYVNFFNDENEKSYVEQEERPEEKTKYTYPEYAEGVNDISQISTKMVRLVDIEAGNVEGNTNGVFENKSDFYDEARKELKKLKTDNSEYGDYFTYIIGTIVNYEKINVTSNQDTKAYNLGGPTDAEGDIENDYYLADVKNEKRRGIYKFQFVGNKEDGYRELMIWKGPADPYKQEEIVSARYNYSVLKPIISGWYYRLLVLATVAMLSVLLYIGIRITISSVATQKAKYKQMLSDWFVGMILLYTMHFIMIFANLAVDEITKFVSESADRNMYLVKVDEDADGNIEKRLTSGGEEGYNFQIVDLDASYASSDQGALEQKAQDLVNSQNIKEGDSESAKIVYREVVEENGKTKKRFIFMTDLMGKLRFDLQTYKSDSEKFIGYTVMFIVMTIYLCVYCYIYIKRVILMAFLTMIAPLVALTYAIDKVNDGQAQGFRYWIREYIFNLLLQPLHLLLYTILISSALQLATTNTVYALVALGFMVPAEKILRKMFNFEKAHTPGVFAGPAGGALLMTGMRHLFGWGPKGGRPPQGSGSSSSKGGSKDDEDKLDVSSKDNKINEKDIDAINLELNGEDNRTTNNNRTNSVEIQNATLNNEQENEPRRVRNFNWPVPTYMQQTENNNNNYQSNEEEEEQQQQQSVDTVYYQQPSTPSTPRTNMQNLSSEDLQESSENSKKSDEVQPIKTRREALKNMATNKGQKIKNSMANTIKDIKKQPIKILAPLSKPARFVVKNGLAITGGAAGTMIGVAAGIATGDMSKVGQNAVFGATGGYKLGGNIGNSVSQAFTGFSNFDTSNNKFLHNYKIERYGAEGAKKREEDTKRVAFINNNNNIQAVLDSGLAKDFKEARTTLSSMVNIYPDNGATTIKDMIAAEKVARKRESEKFGEALQKRIDEQLKENLKVATARNGGRELSQTQKAQIQDQTEKTVTREYTVERFHEEIRDRAANRAGQQAMMEEIEKAKKNNVQLSQEDLDRISKAAKERFKQENDANEYAKKEIKELARKEAAFGQKVIKDFGTSKKPEDLEKLIRSNYGVSAENATKIRVMAQNFTRIQNKMK